jgi:hypothetical protein
VTTRTLRIREPVGAGIGGPTPILNERWLYGSLGAMPSNYFTTQISTSSGGADGSVALVDPGDVPGGGPCIRSTFFNRVDGNSGESSVGTNLSWSDYLGSLPDIWLLRYLRYSPDWTTVFPGASNIDHKSLFIRHDGIAQNPPTTPHNDSGNRWEIHHGWTDGDIMRPLIEGALDDAEVNASLPPNTSNLVSCEEGLFTGTWFRELAHCKQQTGLGVADAEFEVWLSPTTGDYAKVYEQVGFDSLCTRVGGFIGLANGRNLNRKPTQQQHWDLGPVLVYDAPPF